MYGQVFGEYLKLLGDLQISVKKNKEEVENLKEGREDEIF